MSTIKKTLSVTLLLAAVSCTSYAQKVANYFHGKQGTASYQGYSFWVKNGKPTEITFRGGSNRTESKVTSNGKATFNGKPALKMTFPSGKVFYAYPIGEKLAVVNAATRKIETFTWEYEGPVNGIGTFCEPCAEDEKEAITLLKTSYFK